MDEYKELQEIKKYMAKMDLDEDEKDYELFEMLMERVKELEGRL